MKLEQEFDSMHFYENKKCTICGRKYPETMLTTKISSNNIYKIVCVDSITCKKTKDLLDKH